MTACLSVGNDLAFARRGRGEPPKYQDTPPGYSRPGSSEGIATDQELEGPGIESR